jgi:hypothetical protein
MRRFLFFALLLFVTVARADVRVSFDRGEAEAALRVADELALRGRASESSWRALFASAGYNDLATREKAMKREFTEEEFRSFIASDAVVKRRDELRRALRTWGRLDMQAAAKRALRYLPPNASIDVTVYVLVKPKPNSFVFQTERGRAIFLYLDPTVAPKKIENTVVHEMHHIGFATACSGDDDPSTPRGLARRYLGGFGEGLAVLAAARSASHDPHRFSSEVERSIWKRDVKKVASDMKRLETFFADIAAGRLAGDEASTAFMSFIATKEVPQGAFYTVGWHMATTIERARGRKALVALMCDRVAMMRAYNAVVAKDPNAPKWSEALLDAL